MLFWPGDAMAQTYLGKMICNVQGNIAPLRNLYNGIAYIAGATTLLSAGYAFRDYADAPDRKPLHQAIWRSMGGAGLLFLPSMTGWLVSSLFMNPAGTGNASCTPGGVTAMTNDASVLIKNLFSSIVDPMRSLISWSAIIIGLFFIMRGLMKASRYGTDARTYSMPAILANLVAGAMLMTVGQSLDMIMTTIFGSNNITAGSVVSSWKVVNDMGASQQFIDAVTWSLHFVQVMGMLFFVRGWMVVKSAAEGGGQATMAQGFSQIVGGALSINIFSFLKIVNDTIGLNFI
jgi:hypothetical protein